MTTKQETRWCRHHIHAAPMKHECSAGVNIEALVTEQCGPSRFGRHFMLPCHTGIDDETRKATCSKCSIYTVEEHAAMREEIERDMDAAVARIKMTMPLVAKIKSGKEESGSDQCPACHTGSVQWRRSGYNNHVAMRCSTPDCINFIE